MDLFALTSRSEGMPLVVLEAWAAGVPVIASRIGGLPEMIDDGRNGVLFPPGDDVALMEVMANLLADEEFARRLGEEGRQCVEAGFTTRHMFDAYLGHYGELLARKRRGGMSKVPCASHALGDCPEGLCRGVHPERSSDRGG